MYRRFIFTTLMTILAFLLAFTRPEPSHAKTVPAPLAADSANDLINAVNALRASNGLPAYSINSLLMYTAQNQADFMAANGIVTHSGPGGIGLTDRLLAAGYPLAGDLSLGGFRAENITSGSEGMSAQSAVDQWTGDAPHLNTMLSPNLSEIGAGVAVAGGRVYYVIDTALPKTGGPPPAASPVVGGESAVPAPPAGMQNDALVVPVVVINTPNPDGDVIHEVLAGQTLWQIAISYNVKIDDIKRLNNLLDDNIYPGNKLLVQKGVSVVTEPPPTENPPIAVTVPPIPIETRLPVVSSVAATPTSPVVNSAVPANGKVMGAVIAILALGLLVGVVFSWFGSARKS
ncbi:MAG: LysM peptidoglycan-binding domain-containing protein [Anaerolineales bacterium]|nr:LysM peptidoglycan-binding domain-containing protein [Anaerolineales bacterium]